MKTIVISPGEIKQIFFFINIKGRVLFKITNRSGTNSIGLRWIKGPFGSVENLGRITGTGSLEFKGFIWGKLKALDADSETVIQITERAEVANKFPPVEF